MRLCVLVCVAAVGLACASRAWAQDKPDAAEPEWNANITNVEACSCALFCSCYFSGHSSPAGGEGHEAHRGMPGMHYCRFTNAFLVNKGQWGDLKLDGVKFWMAGDLGADYSKGMDWAVMHFDPAVTDPQRQALQKILGHIFPVTWKSFTVGKDAPIEINVTKDAATGKLDGGKMGEVNLKRTEGMSGEPIVIKNLKFWGAPRNDGFIVMGNELLAYRAGDKPYEFRNTNGFVITVDMNSKDLKKAEK